MCGCSGAPVTEYLPACYLDTCPKALPGVSLQHRTQAVQTAQQIFSTQIAFGSLQAALLEFSSTAAATGIVTFNTQWDTISGVKPLL